jgi:hypothetical protein
VTEGWLIDRVEVLVRCQLEALPGPPAVLAADPVESAASPAAPRRSVRPGVSVRARG